MWAGICQAGSWTPGQDLPVATSLSVAVPVRYAEDVANAYLGRP